MKFRPVVGLALLGLLVAAETRAADAGRSVEDRLSALEAQLSELREENATLRRQASSPPAERSLSHPTDSAAVVPGGEESRLRVGGFMQVHAEFGGTGDPRFVGTADRIFLRRARLYLLANFAEHFEAKIEGEFGAGSIAASNGVRAQANELYLAWNRFPAANVRIGQLKPAFGAELLASDARGPMIERSLGAERIGDGRQAGASVSGEWPAAHGGYAVMVGNGAGSNSSANDNNKFLQTARVYFTPGESRSAGSLTVGADALHSSDSGVSKPGYGFDTVPGGAVDNLFTGTRDGWGIDAAWHRGPFDLLTELQHVRFRPVNRLPDRAFTAESWQLTAAYFFVPHRWQAAVRREHFDPNRSRPGDSTDNWMVGLDYYFKGEDIRLIVDYLFGRSAGLPDSHGRLLTRFQIVY